MYNVIIIGAGHAGCEAALASARMGIEHTGAVLCVVAFAERWQENREKNAPQRPLCYLNDYHNTSMAQTIPHVNTWNFRRCS